MSFQIIDLSRLPVPDAIETLSAEAMIAAFKARFLQVWETQRQLDPALPAYETLDLETDSANIVGQSWTYLRLLDRQRVNDAYRALLAPYAKGSDLDAVAADNNVERQIVTPATANTAAVMESDASLLRRYLLSLDAPAAGSPGRYLYDAWTAWPQSDDRTLGLWDARINGRAIHGRRGDTDVVLIGPFGREPTPAELATVRAAVVHPHREPEAVSVSVMAASRREYQVSLVLEIVGTGPSPELLKAEAEKRVTAAAIERTTVGGEIPEGLLSGAAYGANIVRVVDLAPVAIEPDPYTVPVMTGLTVVTEVRS
ncbi:baseplate J/gp47 family protein [Rhizobium nepotum]|uniref:baseplate J/gp47 family protein n=1 Tax=Rhizobium nepotum TaxID=1035271 RepID=UPI00336A8291